MELESLVVHGGATDISGLVQDLTLFESIEGYVQGSIHVIDGDNFFDKVIGAKDTLVPITLTFTYMDIEVTYFFQADGISNMMINKSNKEYNIHLITLVEQGLKLVPINAAFSGASHEIAAGIFEEALADVGPYLYVDSKAITTGKYIVPNISARDALENVVDGAMDIHSTGFYIYQRVVDGGKTRMGSLKHMAGNKFMKGPREEFAIRGEIISNESSEAPGDNIDTIGTSNKFTVLEYKRNFTDKIVDGEFGNKIHSVSLDETTVVKNQALEASAHVQTVYKSSNNLYNTEKNLFATVNDPESSMSVNQMARIHHTRLSVRDLSAIPTIGCGMSVNIELGGQENSASISDGIYIISDINHIMTFNGKNYEYKQHMTLIREYA
jgi:hypothetical protein